MRKLFEHLGNNRFKLNTPLHNQCDTFMTAASGDDDDIIEVHVEFEYYPEEGAPNHRYLSQIVLNSVKDKSGKEYVNILTPEQKKELDMRISEIPRSDVDYGDAPDNDR